MADEHKLSARSRHHCKVMTRPPPLFGVPQFLIAVLLVLDGSCHSFGHSGASAGSSNAIDGSSANSHHYNAGAVQALPIDSVRSEYFRVQAKAWKLLDGDQYPLDVHQQTNLSDTVKAKIVRELFSIHYNYVTFNVSEFETNPNRNGFGAEVALLDTVFPEFEHLYEWKFIEADLHTINNLFEAMRIYLGQNVDSGQPINPLSAMDFAETVFQDNQFPVAKLFESIDNIMVGQGLYYKMALENKDHICSSSRSAQQVLYQMYTAVSLTELKAYAMMQFSWMLLRTYSVGNFSREAELMRQRFEARTLKTQQMLRRVMERADNSVWRCDPEAHVEGLTFERVTRLLQGYIENEVDMNTEGTCRETCSHYQATQSHTCFKELYCSKQPKCNGRVLHCQYVDSDMWICPAREKSLRRYEYIEYENGRVLGKKQTCSRGTTKVDSWWRYLFWHCSYCFCVCDEEGKHSDRYFSLGEATSNITANRIVTGVRLRKLHRIIHFQVQEGELLPNGLVNVSSVAWIPIRAIKLTDRGLQEGVDYHKLGWDKPDLDDNRPTYDKRAIDLDTITGTAGNVVTGIKFRVVGSHLNLEVRTTEFDFERGQLIEPATTSIWNANDETHSRHEIVLKDPAVPTDGKGKSIMNFDSNQYIEFTHSGMDADVAQTTIPYLDAQDVVPNPPVPLIGVGLYHKATRGNGGFIGPKVFTYDVTQHIQRPKPFKSK